MHFLFCFDAHKNISHHSFCCLESSVFTVKLSVPQATHYSQLRIVYDVTDCLHYWMFGLFSCLLLETMNYHNIIDRGIELDVYYLMTVKLSYGYYVL